MCFVSVVSAIPFVVRPELTRSVHLFQCLSVSSTERNIFSYTGPVSSPAQARTCPGRRLPCPLLTLGSVLSWVPVAVSAIPSSIQRSPRGVYPLPRRTYWWPRTASMDIVLRLLSIPHPPSTTGRDTSPARRTCIAPVIAGHAQLRPPSCDRASTTKKEQTRPWSSTLPMGITLPPLAITCPAFTTWHDPSPASRTCPAQAVVAAACRHRRRPSCLRNTLGRAQPPLPGGNLRGRADRLRHRAGLYPSSVAMSIAPSLSVLGALTAAQIIHGET
ncbi:hypothetical protein AURDEDRAFT_178150 [Auricularia subglabra TFB-10046 SS5]|uniref:Uncharacterized protein n=1 Tax=Auricularia subglabra (strain TFB-10046 / SS5) TaxID=717982 RepID=J0WKC1_AURST|nr:hypothetical protein AURDEDRAFT_178150 [Auricularia subglabra TFB-10046 SS5]